ncbi:DUF6468 domain-containing protein [uncultured Rhodospira sp.]|uniref:DUF6468 domain-containing protein n=1 Tax=uncultured Rhodospira sp. TaxID=1936189 RepID=UPI0026237922|nr:DUF6468 domain-containing protein [uncultured Rhodospira sp.]
MSFSFLLDVIIVALLVPTIVFAWILNGRLADLRRNRDELARLISEFNEATQRAESGIPKLRKAADDASRGLQDRVEKAQTLRDDLAFMVDRADTALGKLEDGVQGRRARAPDSAPAPSSLGARSHAPGASAGRASAPGGGVPAPPPVPGRRPVRAAAPPPAATAAASTVSDDGDDQFFIEDERSEAERELLRALQSAR